MGQDHGLFTAVTINRLFSSHFSYILHYIICKEDIQIHRMTGILTWICRDVKLSVVQYK